MIRIFTFFLCACLLTACDSPRRDVAEENNPHIQKAQQQAGMKQWDKAIHQYEIALENHPEYAKPHMDLALIYHQHKKNYIRAIYHYERYMEKRPDSDKAKMVGGWIRQAKILLAAEVGQTSRGINEEIIRLKKENNLLRNQIQLAARKRRPATPIIEPQLPPPVLASAPVIPRRIASSTPSASGTPKTYTVRAGDTLSKISRSIFGTSGKWKEIYEVNRNQMRTANDLKEGQVIALP